MNPNLSKLSDLHLFLKFAKGRKQLPYTCLTARKCCFQTTEIPSDSKSLPDEWFMIIVTLSQKVLII